MKRKLFSILLCLALLASSLNVFVTSVEAASTWGGTSSSTGWTGSGTANSPYLISTAAQLKGRADSVNSGNSYSGKYFKLGDDINLAYHAWTPIGGHCTLTAIEEGGPTGYYFAGNFDGDNHTISGINITNPVAGTGAYGLFGYVQGGTVYTRGGSNVYPYFAP